MYYIIEGELSGATEKTFGAKAPDAQARRRHWTYSISNEAFWGGIFCVRVLLATGCTLRVLTLHTVYMHKNLHNTQGDG